ncbi:sensor histidine kinase [Anaeromyxobacter paludicola]|uniref:sensor histidine kinase n=1 Tax=Anaeromyxobacter paludicola TaxID=2918171 RepID=UPI0020C03F4D|nr:PAS domain-containing protein [Anaeromyxobacter paludicola]
MALPAEEILQALPSAIAVLEPDLPELRYRYVNSAYQQLRPDRAMVGRTVSEVWPEYAAEWLRLAAQVLEGGQRYQAADVPFFRGRPGAPPREVWYSFTFDRLAARPPRPAELLVQVVETTAHVEQRRSAMRLAQAASRSASLLDALFSAAPLGLAFVDRDLRFERVNAALAALDGVAVKEHLGRPVQELLPGCRGEARARDFRRILETGEPMLDVELEGDTPGRPGDVRAWRESWFPVHQGDEVVGLGVVVADVTAERRIAELQKNLMGLVSHDLRTPLSAIRTGVHLLFQQGGPEERRSRILSRMSSSADRMQSIIHDLLDFSRIQASGGLAISRRPARIEEVCARAVQEVRELKPSCDVRLTSHGDGAGEWDPERLVQVVSNLVTNAVQHSRPGAPVLVAAEGLADEVRVEVRNQGEPIPEELRRRLFRPFSRGPRAGSFGLGLYIVREIVRSHGGAVEVRSTPEEGTSFTVRLPRRAAP